MKEISCSHFKKEQIKLRLLEKSDLPITLKWRNKKNVKKWFFYSEMVTRETHNNWFEEYLKNNDDYVYIIEEEGAFNKPIGQISIYNIDWNLSRAELGRLMIGEEKARGKGFAKQAVKLLVSISDIYFGINELYLSVYKDNLPAIHIYEKCGFKKTKEIDDILHMRLLRRSDTKKIK
ncbi:MAG TPA: GNAT family N-acetyltransferase [Candidatus Kapabacteria bacterium]|nr:GNAT family N-acetyltransferase [Candidatus Kapabacteria bacterium]